MKLEKKKALVSRALGVGKGRIVFNQERLADIKEAITKQDARDLVADGAIFIREIKGRRTREKRKTRRRMGSVRKKVNKRKREYITLTRKLRAYVFKLKGSEDITKEEYKKLRREIRASNFRSKAHIKERIQSLGKKK